MHVANLAGIQLFATGGIGGVHRENPQDVSADLGALASIPIMVVCAGAKAILDIPATLERLESASVPMIGFRTDEFPAFYSRTSGHEVSIRLEHPAEIAAYWSVHRSLGSRSAVLIANPIPESHEVQHSEMEAWISEASAEAVREGVHGQALTPFLLRRLAELSGGRSVEANKALLLNNALVASQIAAALVERGHLTEGIEPIR
jgi:pseudouridine-5'-phosphate glycosidase